jgi:hypothetical protein
VCYFAGVLPGWKAIYGRKLCLLACLLGICSSGVWRCVLCFRELRFDTPFLRPIDRELFSTYLLFLYYEQRVVCPVGLCSSLDESRGANSSMHSTCAVVYLTHTSLSQIHYRHRKTSLNGCFWPLGRFNCLVYFLFRPV